MDDAIILSSSDCDMTSKRKKNRRSTCKTQMEKQCLFFKAEDDALFKNRPKIPAFVLKLLKAMLNLAADRIPLKQLFSEIGYCGPPPFPFAQT